MAAGLLSASDSIGLARESTYEKHDSGFVIAQPGSYDSVDTAVVKEMDVDKSRITFMNVETGRYYTLDYDGTTVIQDKYGSGMAMAQIHEGDIVDVAFLRNKKKLASIKLSENAWILEKVEKYSFDVLGKNAEVGGGTYSLRNNLVVFSDKDYEDISYTFKLRRVNRYVMDYYKRDYGLRNVEYVFDFAQFLNKY